jgi:uncharacterized membrane protein
MATRKAGATTRPASGGGKSRDKGTRGGRPEAGATAAKRPSTNGTAAKRPGTQQARGGNGARQDGRQPARGRTATADPAVPQAAATAGPPVWLQWTTWALSLAGLGVSTYLTIAHFNTHVSLACPATSTINCEKVTTSPQSYAFGIPVAVLGLAFYIFMAVVNSPWLWRVNWPPLKWARLGSVVVGIVFVLYLIYSELFTIGAICLWCTSVHVITFCLFALIVFTAAAGYGMTKVSSAARS